MQSFFKQEVMKNKGYEHFCFCLKWLKFAGGGEGVQFGLEKQLLAIKVPFHINKPGFRGLMSKLATLSLFRRPTFMRSYL